MTKECFKCHKVKELDEFYKHPQMQDGHVNKCKLCNKKDVKDRYYSEDGRKRVIEYERKRFKDPKRKAKIKIYARNRVIRHPNKVKANRAVSHAIKKGVLKRLPCEVCGEIKSQAHHPDYRRPLYIKWLCFKHHREEHNQIVSNS